MRTYICSVCFIVLSILLAACASTAQLAQVDQAVRSACELLALRQQALLQVDAKRIIATTCAVDSFTRDLRDELLRRQLEAANAAGVPTVPVSAERLADEPDGGP